MYTPSVAFQTQLREYKGWIYYCNKSDTLKAGEVPAIFIQEYLFL